MIKTLKQYLSLRGLLARRLKAKRKKIYLQKYRTVRGVKENGGLCFFNQYKSIFGIWKLLNEESFCGYSFSREYGTLERAKEHLKWFKRQQIRKLLPKR